MHKTSIVLNVLDFDIVVNEFKQQSRSYDYFWTYTHNEPPYFRS